MICNKCNHKLPDDSEFCQYCGNKIEKVVVAPVEEVVEEPKKVETPVVVPAAPVIPVASVIEEEPNIADMSPDDALSAILKIQAKNTVEAMEANSKTQPDNEGDADFGLVPEKPIYTLAVQSVDGEIEYLGKLYTINGEKIRYSRRGSTSAKGINGMIDIYDTFLPSGKPYKTIYINMYGAKKSTKAPAGFVLSKAETLHISKKDNIVLGNNSTTEKWLNDKLVLCTNLLSFIFTIISIVSIIITMNIQDKKRNVFENWNPTVVYIALSLILVILLGFAINSLVKKRFKSLPVLSGISMIAAIIAFAEGSIISDSYYYGNENRYYFNSDNVAILNGIWFACVIFVLIVSLMPIINMVIIRLNNNWHKSVSYREKCYKRVSEIYSYFEKGIITKEEYEKLKSDILKHIK